MAARRVVKIILLLLASPLCLISLFLERITCKGFRTDIELCLEITARLGSTVPETFIDALILAEDHRNELHPGVDVIAVVRALWVRLLRGHVQGASTIEQQFVRVVTNRNERTIRRKFREQMLALMLVRQTNKRCIASAYLSVAFYGSGLVGLEGLRLKFGERLEKVAFAQALEMVAQLKYPSPQIPNIEWKAKLTARIDALYERVSETANMPLQQKTNVSVE